MTLDDEVVQFVFFTVSDLCKARHGENKREIGFKSIHNPYWQ